MKNWITFSRNTGFWAFSVFKSMCSHLSFPEQHMHRHVCLKTFSSSLFLPTRVPCLIRLLFSACRLKPKPTWIPWHPGKLSLRLNLQTPPVPRAHGLRGRPTPDFWGKYWEFLSLTETFRSSARLPRDLSRVPCNQLNLEGVTLRKAPNIVIWLRCKLQSVRSFPISTCPGWKGLQLTSKDCWNNVKYQSTRR